MCQNSAKHVSSACRIPTTRSHPLDRQGSDGGGWGWRMGGMDWQGLDGWLVGKNGWTGSAPPFARNFFLVPVSTNQVHASLSLSPPLSPLSPSLSLPLSQRHRVISCSGRSNTVLRQNTFLISFSDVKRSDLLN